jgi:NAD(P)-dependent dehydrogenase (short-subunit alcohol dehydrogenase family)
MNLEFDGRRVVVTGGSGALGEAVVKALVGAGALVHVPVRSAESLARFEMARHRGVHVEVGVDLTDEGAIGAYYEGLPALWASVHCAGVFAMSPLEGTSEAEFGKMMWTNAWTCFLCSREAVRRIRASGAGRGGRIVNVASRQALEPRQGAGMIAYTASKAAVAAITVAMAQELAGEGIWVNAVAPSILDTDANREAMPGADPSAWVKVDEAAATIAFLASPQNTSTRGGLVPVYGRG